MAYVLRGLLYGNSSVNPGIHWPPNHKYVLEKSKLGEKVGRSL